MASETPAPRTANKARTQTHHGTTQPTPQQTPSTRHNTVPHDPTMMHQPKPSRETDIPTAYTTTTPPGDAVNRRAVNTHSVT